MSKVVAINEDNISPAVVINSLIEKVDKIADIYAVTVNKEGKFEIWSSGDLSRLSDAAVLLQHLAYNVASEKMAGMDE